MANPNYVHFVSHDPLHVVNGMPRNRVYLNTHEEVQRIASAVAHQGSILRIPSPGLNASWQTQFLGPSLKCRELDFEDQLMLTSRFLCPPPGSKGKMYYYTSWTSFLSPFLNKEPFIDPVLVQLFRSITAYLAPWPLYVAIYPNFQSVHQLAQTIPEESCNRSIHHNEYNEWTQESSDPRIWSAAHQVLAEGQGPFLQCDIFNSSYEVEFQHVNGEQQVGRRIIQHEKVQEPYGADGWSLDLSVPSCPIDPPRDADCVFDTFIQRMLPLSAYRSVYDAFRLQIVGMVYSEFRAKFRFVQSNVLSTVLSRSPELGFLKNTTFATELNAWLAKQGGVLVPPPGNNQGLVQAPPLAHDIEELFQNVTISMMSSDFLR
jgi:hypothetical protein